MGGTLLLPTVHIFTPVIRTLTSERQTGIKVARSNFLRLYGQHDRECRNGRGKILVDFRQQKADAVAELLE